MGIRPSVVLADDNSAFLRAVQRLLEPHVGVLGAAHSGCALIEMARRLSPDVVVLDISMPAMNGIEALRQLRSDGVNWRAVFLTVHEERELIEEAMSAGAMGYVLKSFADTELVEAVRCVAEGNVYVSEALRVH